MGRAVAWVGLVTGGLVIVLSVAKDLVRLLQYRATFPRSSDSTVGLVALAIVVAVGLMALLGAAREWRGRRVSGWLIGPAVAVLIRLADPLLVYPPAAFSPQMMWYLSIYPLGWPRVAAAAALAWGTLWVARWIDARRPSVGTSAAR